MLYCYRYPSRAQAGNTKYKQNAKEKGFRYFYSIHNEVYLTSPGSLHDKLCPGEDFNGKESVYIKTWLRVSISSFRQLFFHLEGES